MADPNHPCIACRIVREDHRPPGGVLWRGSGLAVHALDGPTPLPGWLVVTSEVHVRGWYDLPPEAAAALGGVAARALRAQREVLGAEHLFAFAIGARLHPFHRHLVPRYADTPARLRGRGAFESRPEDALPAWRVVAALETLRRAVGRAQPAGT